MLEIVKRELNLKVYGEEYKLLFPNNRMVSKYRKDLASKNEDEQEQAIYSLLEDCGLPKTVTEEMEPEHLVQVLKVLIPGADEKK